MSTRSYIGISTVEEGINYIKYVYCHFDGYTINGVGQMLFEHYKDEEKVKKLISLGDISFLEKNIEPSSSKHSFNTPEKDVTVFYHRDRGDMKSGPYKIYQYQPQLRLCLQLGIRTQLPRLPLAQSRSGLQNLTYQQSGRRKRRLVQEFQYRLHPTRRRSVQQQ